MSCHCSVLHFWHQHISQHAMKMVVARRCAHQRIPTTLQQTDRMCPSFSTEWAKYLPWLRPKSVHGMVQYASVNVCLTSTFAYRPHLQRTPTSSCCQGLSSKAALPLQYNFSAVLVRAEDVKCVNHGHIYRSPTPANPPPCTAQYNAQGTYFYALFHSINASKRMPSSQVTHHGSPEGYVVNQRLTTKQSIRDTKV